MFRRPLGALVLAWAIALGAPACDVFLGSSKIEHGELYQSGDPAYDRFFADVHDKQVAAEKWDDEKKAARAPLVKALGLPETAGHERILAVLKNKKQEATPVAGQTAGAEAGRSKKLAHAAEVLEALSKKGAELKERAAEEKKNMAADKANDEKVKQRDQVRREVQGATRVCDKLAREARSQAKEADELVAALKEAVPGVSVGGGEVPPAASTSEAPPPAKKPAGKPAGKPKPAPQPKPDAPKPDAPKPDPKPAPSGQEVFEP